jgi:hypothetical protein
MWPITTEFESQTEPRRDSDTTSKSANREERSRTLDPDGIDLILERRVEDSFVSQPARLLDLSRGGAKLAVTSPLGVGEAVRLHLKIADLDLDATVASKVCWTSPAEDGPWWAGCVFTPRLPGNVLAKLAGAGHIERRQADRQTLSLELEARWELSPQPTKATLRDFSKNGFCLLVPETGKAGLRVSLRFNKPDGAKVEVFGKAHWEVKVADGYLIGCEFRGRQSYEALRRLAEPTATRTTRRAPWWRRMSMAKVMELLGCPPEFNLQ